ncbi:3-phosphoshikimate 1-carboxyvinyltransferase [Candidatus Gottesmanbacteria bacterium]|nr:3-phosphoshikimate 1-carboxyvinyltransferase [Candidatus Gottesmanbacteria bacterium]
MKVVIKPSKVSGTIVAPPSKSYTHRAIILAVLSAGNSLIKNALISNDTKATIEACKLLGAKIKRSGNNIEIEGTCGDFPKKKSPVTIDCHESGTTIRLMTGVATISSSKVVLTGDKRLMKRPIGELVRTLKSLGVNISASGNNQFSPVTIKGGSFKGGKINISGKMSSQFISALLLIAPFAKKDTVMIVEDLKSKPYVDITLDMMKTFGVEVEIDGNIYKVKAGQKYKAQKYTVEGDYSSASYFFAAAAITNSKITVKNLNPNSVQGDKYFLEVLKQMNTKNLHGIDVNLENYPDIVPSVAIVAAKASGETRINNIKHLRTKESDRIQSVVSQLSKMRIKVKTTDDSMIISGGNLKGALIDTFNDHRIAMSMAIAGLAAKGETIINNAEVVNKSYPDFWKDLEKVGAKIKIIN